MNAMIQETMASRPCETGLFWNRDTLPSPFRTAFTLRAGGSSNAPYESLNMGLHVGDDPRRVRANRTRALSSLGLDGNRSVTAQQIHGAACVQTGCVDAGRGWFSHADALEGVDALVTRDRRLPLMCLNADCLLLALGDPQSGVLGVLHAGWRGMAAGVIENTVATILSMGAKSGQIHARGGPSIGPCCFEVGNEVVDALGADCAIFQDGKKPMFDLRAAALKRLEKCGLSRANVQIDSACTCCDPAQFFSHRRATRGENKQQTGRMALIAWID